MSVRRSLGRLLPAPENFIPDAVLEEISADGLDASRRDFLRKSFVAASATLAASGALAASDHPAPEGDSAILQPSAHSTRLGNPVVFTPYGSPSKHEANLQRRESPGLTRKRESSISFTPLQGLFGIITPSGLHFERHHAGWHDIDPR